MRASVLLLMAIVGSFAIPSAVRATPPDVFGYGARTQGAAMTGTAYVDDYEAVWANPAGLAAAERSGISLGLQAASFELQLDGQDFDLEAYRGTTIGFHLRLPFGGVLEDVLTIGAGFYTPLNTVLRTDIIYPETPQWAVLARTQSVNLAIGLGIDLDRWVPGLRLGLGFSALATITGRLQVQLDQANSFTSLTETQLLVSYNPIVGVQYDFGDFSLGVVYREEVRSEIDLNIVVENLPVALPTITITALPQYDPHTVAAEFAWRFTPHWMGAVHLTYRRWSAFPGVVGQTSSSSFYPVHPAFRDTVSPRLAFEYHTRKRRTEIAARFGYAYEMTPAPPAALRPARDMNDAPRVPEVLTPSRYIDGDRHVFTVGNGVTFHSKLGPVMRFDLFLQLHRMPERTHDIPRTDEGTSNMVTEGWLVAGGWTGAIEW